MTTLTHADHTHNEDCGHTAVKHGDHVDYLVDGHLHHQEGDTVTEHVIEVSDTNPDGCKPIDAHADHQYGDGCGHEQVPYGDHVDFLVNGRLHHPHDDHCDDHGPVERA